MSCVINNVAEELHMNSQHATKPEHEAKGTLFSFASSTPI